VPDLTWWEATIRLLVAACLGGAIGFERELRERGAGLRTHMLVALGSALFMLVSAYAWSDWVFSTTSGVTFDPTRIAAQVVSGIGFLGAGAIIRQGLSVRGLTTAATLWVTAAIGLASGAGYYGAAVATTFICLISLWPLRVVVKEVVERVHPPERTIIVQLPPGTSPAILLEVVEEGGGHVDSIELEDSADQRLVTLHVSGAVAPAALVSSLGGVKDIVGVRWQR
jgi:putative Mg2+ transporter-C (MgtC) family protein